MEVSYETRRGQYDKFDSVCVQATCYETPSFKVQLSCTSLGTSLILLARCVGTVGSVQISKHLDHRDTIPNACLLKSGASELVSFITETEQLVIVIASS